MKMFYSEIYLSLMEKEKSTQKSKEEKRNDRVSRRYRNRKRLTFTYTTKKNFN